jgi:hypothetical protein
MLTVLGTPRRCCDGLTRRESLQAGALAVLGGLGLADVVRAEGSRRAGAPAGKARNVIVLFLLGGAASQDMVDLKPGAPADIIATVYRCLEIDPELPLYDRGNRPHPAAQGGRPIQEILA